MAGTGLGSGRRASALLVPAALVLANLLSYVLLLTAGRRLDRVDYGELLSLLAVLLVASVPALAMQTLAARRTAVGSTGAGLFRGAVVIGACSTAALLAATPMLRAFLHLHTSAGLLVVVGAVPGLTALGTQQGIAQGARRFGPLAALVMATVGGRSVGGLIGLWAGLSSTWCLVGAAAGITLAAGIAVAPSLSLRQRRGDTPPMRDLIIEALHAAHGHGAFLLVSGIDVLLARHVLTGGAAGTYAAGSVVTRAALWLPQSVAVLMFASFTVRGRHRRAYARAAGGVAVMGAVTVAGVAVLGRFTVSVVAGARFHVLDDSLWIYATIGASLAVLQLSIVAGLALRHPGRIAIIWGVAVADATLVLTTHPDTATGVARWLAMVSFAGAVVSVVLAIAPRGDDLVDAGVGPVPVAPGPDARSAFEGTGHRGSAITDAPGSTSR